MDYNMPVKSYHHGDLKNALIEAGIEIINQSGEEQLSLRKVAAKCGVSNAAPYAHFACKEDMIHAMQEHVTASFMEDLDAAYKPLWEAGQYSDALLAMGNAYVTYFLKHPTHYYFLFSQPCMKADLSVIHDSPDNFPPYALMRKLVIQWCHETSPDMKDDDIELQIIRMWASVHGIAAIANMKNVTWEKDWTTEIANILR